MIFFICSYFSSYGSGTVKECITNVGQIITNDLVTFMFNLMLLQKNVTHSRVTIPYIVVAFYLEYPMACQPPVNAPFLNLMGSILIVLL